MLSNKKKLTLNEAVERITFCERNLEEINMFFKVLEREGENFKLDLVVKESAIVNSEEEYELNTLLSKMVIFELDKIASGLEEVLYTLTNNSEVSKYNFNYIGENETLESSIQNHVKTLTERELLERLHFSRHLSYVTGSTYDLLLKKGGFEDKAADKKGLFSAFRKRLRKDNLENNREICLMGCARTEWKGYSIFEAVRTAIEAYQEALIEQVHAIGYSI